MKALSKFKIRKIHIIEAISLAAGLATLVSTSDTFIHERRAEAKEAKARHRIAIAPARTMGVHKVVSAELVGDPIVTDKDFSDLVQAETQVLAALPPLMSQLHKDVFTLNQLKATSADVSSETLAKLQVIADREAIIHVLLTEEANVSEIVPAAKRDQIERILLN